MDKLKKCVSGDVWNDYSVGLCRRDLSWSLPTAVPADDVTTGH